MKTNDSKGSCRDLQEKVDLKNNNLENSIEKSEARRKRSGNGAEMQRRESEGERIGLRRWLATVRALNGKRKSSSR